MPRDPKSMSERVLICGSRNWGKGSRDDWQADFEAMWRYISHLPEGTVVIEGDNGGIDDEDYVFGADFMAGHIASVLSYELEVYPADWKKYGKRAGPIRNQQMLDEGRPTKVAYAHRNLIESKGTADMIRRARKAGLPVEAIV